MNPHSNEFEELIRKRMERLPMSENAPDNLKDKIYEESRRRPSPMPRRRLMVAGLTVAAGLALTGLYLGSPKQATAKTWTMVKQAVDKVDTMLLTMHSSGQNQEKITIAYAPGKLAVNTGKGPEIYVMDGTLKIYDAKEKTVRQMEIGDKMLPDMARVVGEGINLKEMLRDFELEHGRENIKISPIRTESGRGIYTVTLRDPKHKGGAVVDVDAATDLPIRIEASGMDGDSKQSMLVTIRYNDAISVDVFTPKFPADTKVEVIDMSKLGKFDDLGDAFAEGFGK